MYYNIIHVESVDEHGNKIINLQGVTTAPQYDDITPSDMSMENQIKAGIKQQRVSTKSRSSLENADKAESALYRDGDSIEVNEPTSTVEPTPVSEPTPTVEPKTE